MRIAGSFALLALASLPVAGAAQSSPTADAFRRNIAHAEKNLVASAEEMPADKYSYKPTPAQMTFGEIVLHVAADSHVVIEAHKGNSVVQVQQLSGRLPAVSARAGFSKTPNGAPAAC